MLALSLSWQNLPYPSERTEKLLKMAFYIFGEAVEQGGLFSSFKSPRSLKFFIKLWLRLLTENFLKD